MAGSTSTPPPRRVAPTTSPETPTVSSAAPFSASTPNSGASAADGGQQIVKLNPTPNVMGDYYQPTYHFRWYLLSDAVDPATAAPDTGLTIAETGATGLNIQDVEIETFIGPNSQTRNSTGTNITITIVEPIGAMLPNVLYRAASELQIRNYHKAPWMLELKLLGYDSTGKRQVIDGKSWTWPIMLLNVESKISAEGASHTVTAMPLEEVALDNQYCMLTEAFSVDGRTSANGSPSPLVGDILKDLGDRMSKAADMRYGDGFLKYTFEDRPYEGDSGNASIASPFMHKIVTDQPQQNDERNQGVAQISPGTDIPHVIDALMSASDTAIAQARLSRSINFDDDMKTGMDPESDTTTVKPFSLMHRIDTDVKITSWNPVVQDYCREIKYVIRPYDTVRLITNRPNAMAFTQDVDFQRKKASYAVSKNYLSKVYDYVFTGLNTEVLNFDISLNFNWTVAVPMLGGKIHYGSTTIPRQINEQHWQDYEFWQAIQQEKHAIQQLQDLIDQGGGSAAVTQAANQTVANATNQVNQAQSASATQQSDAIAAETKDFAARRQQLANVTGYAEKLEEESSSNAKPLPALPISITDDADKPNAGSDFSISSQWHQGRSVYGSLLNQMYGAVDGNLMNIDLQIRGDPYWLGPPGLQVLKTRDDAKPSADSGNWMNGEHMFLFRFKIPQGYNPSNGGVKLSPYDLGDTDTYNGFYAAIQVTHKFREGQFTQVLNATRLPGWEVSKVLDISGDAPAKVSGGN